MRPATSCDGRGRVAFFQCAQPSNGSDRRDRHQRQDHNNVSARVNLRSGRHSMRHYRYDRDLRWQPHAIQRPHDARINRFRRRVGRDVADGRAAAAEISSIGLDEGRVEELNFRACVFTGLGRDHLDYHGNLENYFAAKLHLFTDLLPRSNHPEPVAIVRGDDPYGNRVLASVTGRKLSFGLDAGLDVHPISFEAGLAGIRASVHAAGRMFEVHSSLLGKINLLNILCACALSVALGIETDAVVEGVRRCPGAPGRLEAVAGPAGVKVLVDYAHKPDALEAVLESLRALNPRRLLCVFGCGGDRDRGKRPIMGEIAGRFAGLPILTSDNPRTEDPLSIIKEVEAGISQSGLARVTENDAAHRPGYLVEPDRRTAIAMALRLATPGDIVVIAGKGHEDYQLVQGRKLDFDDRVVVREITAQMRAGGGC